MAKKSPAPPFIAGPDRPAEMPFEAMHVHIEEAIGKLKVPHIRHACRSAFEHLRKAWILHPIDAEMSSFRAITAEEEAASAVIRALRYRAYPNSRRLNDRNHVLKSALWPFITAISDAMAEKDIPAPKLSMRVEGDPRVELSVDVGSLSGMAEPLWATPDEPFNFSMTSDRTGSFKLHDFSDQLAVIADVQGARDIEAHVKEQANMRNRLLYASPEGMPSVAFEDAYLLARRQRVIILLVLTIAIMQTDKHQLFVVQCLDALLRAISTFDGDELELPIADKGVARLELVQQPDGSMRLSQVVPLGRITVSYTISQGS